eukprot:gb/GEZN01005169.1/.p1 GENE.gb/GEZN01005169.1/~~gb/GEZN01005169.1/.p1  ORF type:complete len:467 (-),score=66.70 gb/GEZN01005169.1/:402-1802(-)
MASPSFTHDEQEFFFSGGPPGGRASAMGEWVEDTPKFRGAAPGLGGFPKPRVVSENEQEEFYDDLEAPVFRSVGGYSEIAQESPFPPLMRGHAQEHFAEPFAFQKAEPFAFQSGSAKNLSAAYPVDSLAFSMASLTPPSKQSKQELRLSELELRTLPAGPISVDPVPAWFEPFSSFFSTTAVRIILLTVMDALENLKPRSDFSFTPSRQCIRGVTYLNTSSASWVFKVYSAGVDNHATPKFLCEFQRRSGCCVGFRQFYQAISRACASLNISADNSQAVPSTPSSSPPYNMPSVTPQHDLSADCLKSLGGWISKVHCDEQVEGIRALASLVSLPEYQTQLVEKIHLVRWLAGAENSRKSPLLSPDCEIQRLSICVLATLSTNPLLQKDLADKLLDTLLQVIEQPASLYKLDAQRTAKQCIKSLARNPSVRSSILLNKHQTSKLSSLCRSGSLNLQFESASFPQMAS